MKLYHGSKKVLKNPTYKGSNLTNDYGPAFYLTEELESAKEWACKNNSVGFVNEYNLDLNNLTILNLTDKEKWSVLNWVAILLHFRELDSSFKKSFAKRLIFLEEKYYVDVEKYDVVIGFRADDAYFRFPLDFVRGNLTVEQLNYVYKLGKLGIQYALMSEKAIQKIAFKKSFLSEKEYINKYFENVKKSTKLFDDLSKDEDGTRITDLVKDYDFSR